MVEFTGERVIPGEVDTDLWNEHISRYAFASRLARRKRVLDAGCGTGYGSAELSRVADAVVGVDIASGPLRYAVEHYPIPNLRFLQASCSQLPLASGAFDLVVAFEMIEHLTDWRAFLAEARRVLAPGGQCVISTPNKDYYADSRGGGSNPYHVHEFTYQEFRDELRAVFPHVSLFLQNHAEGFVFQPVKVFTPAEARVESGAGNPEDSHFFLAVCALAPQTGAPTYLFVPRAANILRERELHIERLSSSVAELGRERDNLLEMYRQQNQELEERNRWAERLNGELEQAGAVVRRLQSELAEQSAGYEAQIARLQAEIAERSSAYEARLAELEEEGRQKTAWALQGDARVASAVEALHAVEKTLEERTAWALSLDQRLQQVEASLSLLRSSRWVKFGSALGMGPRLQGG